MNARAGRLYGSKDARLEAVELEGAGEDVVVEIVTNTICLSDHKALSLGTGHKRVPKDIAEPISCIVSAFRSNCHHPFGSHAHEMGVGNGGLWCKEADDYLLANAPKVEIGALKVKIVERRIMV